MNKGMWSPIVLLIALVGCDPPPKPTVSNPSGTNTTATDTVYDRNSSREDDLQNTRYDEQYIGEEEALREDDLGTEQRLNLESSPLQLAWDPVYFHFDEANLTEDARLALADYARTLRDNAELEVLLEGHCDSRGTEEYNMALGERRVQTVLTYFVQLGIPETRLKTISYGELRPQDPRESEEAWAQNRRVSFTFPVDAQN